MHSGWRVNIPARLLEQSSVGARAVGIEDQGRLAQCGGRFRRPADSSQGARLPEQGDSSVTLLPRKPKPEVRGFSRSRKRVVTATELDLRACYGDCDVSKIW
jgi:hypothetical protein